MHDGKDVKAGKEESQRKVEHLEFSEFPASCDADSGDDDGVEERRRHDEQRQEGVPV